MKGLAGMQSCNIVEESGSDFGLTICVLRRTQSEGITLTKSLDSVTQGCQKEAAAVLRRLLGVCATPTSLK